MSMRMSMCVFVCVLCAPSFARTHARMQVAQSRMTCWHACRCAVGPNRSRKLGKEGERAQGRETQTRRRQQADPAQCTGDLQGHLALFELLPLPVGTPGVPACVGCDGNACGARCGLLRRSGRGPLCRRGPGGGRCWALAMLHPPTSLPRKKNEKN